MRVGRRWRCCCVARKALMMRWSRWRGVGLVGSRDIGDCPFAERLKETC